MEKFKELESKLKIVVEKHIKSFPVFDGTENSVFKRLSHYEKNKKPFIIDFNFHIDIFIAENDLTITEKEKLNALTSKYESKLIYGFGFPQK